MKMKRLHFFLLLAGILLTACGGDDDVTSGGDTPKPVTPSNPTSWSLEITSPVTRGLSGNTSGITPTWSTSDRIYVYYENQRVGVLHPKENKNNAKDYVQLEGNLDTPVSGAYSNSGKLSFYYQCDKGFSDYTGQDGTLATIASRFDYHKAENVPITDVDAVNRKVTVGKFNLKPQQAIARFSFTRPLVAGDVITIKEGTTTISSVTLGANVAEYANVDNPSCYVYVALPLTATEAKYTLTFDIKHGNDENFYKTIMAADKMQNGKTYKAALVLAVEINGVWWATRNVVDNSSRPFTNNEYDDGNYFDWGRTTKHIINSDIITNDHFVDAASTLWGPAWRMPTKADADALVLKKVNLGTNGWLFQDGDKYIILPMSGCMTTGSTDLTYYETNGFYWTKTPSDATYSWRIDLSTSSANVFWQGGRNYGVQIRPVLDIQ